VDLSDKQIHNINLEGADYSTLEGKQTFVALGKHDKVVSQIEIPVTLSGNNYFVTSRYCISALANTNATLWASGTRTLKKLVKAGFWVSGSAGSLGHNEIKKLNSSKAIQLMVNNNEVEVLSHDKASSPIGKTIACYKRVINETDFDPNKYEVFYWNSFFQYEAYTHHYPEIKSKTHACGLGKTFDQFQSANINITPFADMNTLKNICDTNL